MDYHSNARLYLLMLRLLIAKHILPAAVFKGLVIRAKANNLSVFC
jgi:hypothetical protein